jgi:type II secretory pathway pseudopilin PulG
MSFIQTATQRKKNKELKLKKSAQPGFSFLELMIVFALLGLLGAFVVPNLFRAKQGAHRKEFVASFEHLLKDAVLRAILTNSMHQIFIDLAGGTIQTRIYDPQSIETNRHKKFKALVDDQYLARIPSKDQKNLDLKRFALKNFFINGIEELQPGTATLDISFYIMPDGTSQAIIANLVDQDEDGLEPDVQFSYEINPFNARMVLHDAFQTP